MSLNTIRTSAGYVKSLVRKYTPMEPKSESLEDIYNYLPISDLIYTSGQPTEKQFELIKSEGFEHVINLAPHKAENSLSNERETLTALGMSYVHIPVNFVNPTELKFERFKEEMAKHTERKVWVHCAANMRVSAFMYRYRTCVLGVSEEIARGSLSQIWEPFGVWKKFISVEMVEP